MAVRDVVQAAAGALGGDKLYVEDVFSTYLYTGNGSTQTITNGIDLDGEGGLVWFKGRSAAFGNYLFDTDRGALKYISSNTTNPQATSADSLTSFNSNGFTLGSSSIPNNSGTTFASWTFRKAEKFFDVVTWTGNGLSSQTIPHNLDSAPGFVVIKATGLTQNWWVYHRSLGTGNYMVLNTTATSNGGTIVSATSSTDITVGSTTTSAGYTYVAYLFAHDAGGFGDSGEENVISCGSYVGNGSTTGPVINLGYEPQWLMIKNASDSANWLLFDTMRGIPTGSADALLLPNSTAAETANANPNLDITATGFYTNSTSNTINASGNTYIYIAIRRGPMKTPESGTEVFSPIAQTGGSFINTSFPVDLLINRWRDNSGQPAWWVDRLRGAGLRFLRSDSTSAEDVYTTNYFPMTYNTGVEDDWNGSGNQVYWNFRRAPGFFDVVCYTGTGVAGRTVAHNLGVVPELVIVKKRSNTGPWNTLYQPSMRVLTLNASNEFKNASLTKFYFGNNVVDVSPTSSTFTVASDAEINESGATFVAYLFASCPGVSKVGSYTGTGTTQQINCGFSAGSRFVLIKRTDASASWYVWDTARGIVAGNDPYLLLNGTAPEVTNTDYIDTYSAGFEISSTAPADINANGGTFIFLAIA